MCVCVFVLMSVCVFVCMHNICCTCIFSLVPSGEKVGRVQPLYFFNLTLLHPRE